MECTNEPLVTVYITNHNYGKFIDRAIQSVLKQTLQNFELIIIDDGSTDNSKEIIEGYSKYPDIVCIYQHNKGLNVTNNIAIRAAHGKYIMRLDADDYLDENALMVLSGVLDRNPDVGLVFPDYYIIDENECVLEIARRHNFEDVTLMDQPAHGACTLIRRSFLLELGGYDESFKCQDGYELWLRFIQKYKVKNVNLPLFYYRRHSSNLTGNEKRILSTRTEIIKKHAYNKGRKLSAVGIIPVRGNAIESNSLAYQKLGEKTVLQWTIDEALKANRLSDVIITSPDSRLLTMTSEIYKERVLTVKREEKLALPNTFIEDTLKQTIVEYTKRREMPDIIVVLYIEAPFRTAQQIDSLVDTIELFDTDSVVSVRPDTSMFYRHNGDGLVPLHNVGLLRLEREELYREAGKMFAVKSEFLQSSNKAIGGRVGHVVLDELGALTLRTKMDWEIASWYADKKGQA